MAFGLGCLKVFNEQNEEFSIQKLWEVLKEYDKEFPFKYAVYHKLRSKGWVLKYGIKYGCDFCKLYFKP